MSKRENNKSNKLKYLIRKLIRINILPCILKATKQTCMVNYINLIRNHKVRLTLHCAEILCLENDDVVDEQTEITSSKHEEIYMFILSISEESEGIHVQTVISDLTLILCICSHAHKSILSPRLSVKLGYM